MPAPDYASEIVNLETAISSGELKVEQDGEQVWYQSTSAMITALNYFRDRAAAAAAGPRAAGSFGFSAPAYSRD